MCVVACLMLIHRCLGTIVLLDFPDRYIVIIHRYRQDLRVSCLFTFSLPFISRVYVWVLLLLASAKLEGVVDRVKALLVGVARSKNLDTLGFHHR